MAWSSRTGCSDRCCIAAPRRAFQSSTDPGDTMGSQTAGSPLSTVERGSVSMRDIPLASHSRFVQRVRRRYASELALLPEGLPDRSTLIALVERLQAGGAGLAQALRVARQLTVERLAVLDVEEG